MGGVGRKDQVGGLDVAVDEVVGVEMVEEREEGAEQIDDLGFVEGALSGETLEERLAFDELLNEEGRGGAIEVSLEAGNLRVVTDSGELGNFLAEGFGVIGREAFDDAAGVSELVSVEAEEGLAGGAEGLVCAVAIAQ